MERMFRQKITICLILICIALLFNKTTLVSAENGVDDIPNLEDTPLENLSFTTPSTDLSNWELVVSTSNSSENITKLKLETQICVYDPIVCYPPDIRDMGNNGSRWNGEITTLEKHSYVNWRIHIIYENESELLVPQRSDGYAKVWSSCWEIMADKTIINNFDDVNCNVDDSKENIDIRENISGFPIITSFLSLILASVVIRKN